MADIAGLDINKEVLRQENAMRFKVIILNVPGQPGTLQQGLE
ncbi:hypothetical protein PRUB_a0326 [Pseudoalteromonas rubra]|uniref:Uncharacterized protein n=1 Tax=Pseudoalteromonas rubra TaxID=43658 RepID=A0A8T0C694_9GAMM|nr:hypothetical protein PRUB_a0326 [Pseudoalteromonas rubra]